MNRHFATDIELPFIAIPAPAQEPPRSDLPDPGVVNYYLFENQRKLYIDYEVDDSILHVQRMIMRWNMEDAGKPVEERTPIRLYIFSPGGELTSMWALIDAIMLSETPVHTINVGLAASAASLIFMSGSKRYMLPNAKVLIHEGSAQISGDATKVRDASEYYKKDLKNMKEFILSRTSIPKATLNKKRSNDWELTAEECKQFDVCTDIVSSLNEIL